MRKLINRINMLNESIDIKSIKDEMFYKWNDVFERHIGNGFVITKEGDAYVALGISGTSQHVMGEDPKSVAKEFIAKNKSLSWKFIGLDYVQNKLKVEKVVDFIS